MKKRKAIINLTAIVTAYVALSMKAKKTNESPEIDNDNPYLKRLHKETAKKCSGLPYERIGKCIIDKSLSFFGLLVLAPVYGVISLAIELDDPGLVFFVQKRVAKDGRFFYLHKFRSMKMNTPHDVPTHMLKDPEQYITRVGRFLRRTSLDELPQIWDIFRGKMSTVGPRPALWNQSDLIAERDKYGANDVKPGLTGWAQINGRDELSIEEKARYDGEYVERLSFAFDCKCFFGTIGKVLRHEGVVEGGAEKRPMQGG